MCYVSEATLEATSNDVVRLFCRWFHQGAAQLVSVARATAQAELRLSGLKALFDSLGAESCDKSKLLNSHKDLFHFISFHFISFHFISFHFISYHFISYICIINSIYIYIYTDLC